MKTYNHEANYPPIEPLPAIGVISRINFEAFLDGYLTIKDLRMRTFIIPLSLAGTQEYIDARPQPAGEG
jgi:hypothetical protein